MSEKLKTVEASIIISGFKPEQVYNAAKNHVAKYPEFMKDVEEVIVIEEGKDPATGLDYTETEWITLVDGTPFIWTQKDLYHEKTNDGSYLMTWELQEGDLNKFSGQWRFESIEEGTKVYMIVHFDLGIPHLEDLIGPTLNEKMRENSQMLLDGLKEMVAAI